MTMDSPRPPPEPGTIVLVFEGRIARAGIPGLCERVRVVLDACGHELVICDVAGVDDPDAATVDALARLQLVARRLGRRLSLRDPCDELLELLALTGLDEVVPVDDPPTRDP
ncbi:MAG: STAS domain-containing protein [Actinomycetota bacterium]